MKNKYEKSKSINTNTLVRNLPSTEVFVHELEKIKQEIVDGIPISRANSISWSIFCLGLGSIFSDLLSRKEISMNYFYEINPIILVVLSISASICILLFLISKPRWAAIESINEILKQCGHNK